MIDCVHYFGHLLPFGVPDPGFGAPLLPQLPLRHPGGHRLVVSLDGFAASAFIPLTVIYG